MPEQNALSLLQIPQVQPEGPLDAAMKVNALRRSNLNLQTGAQSLQINKLKLQQAQEEAQDNQDVRQAAQETNGDLDKIQQVLQTRNPRAAAKFAEELATQRKTKAEADKQSIDNAVRTTDLLGQYAQSISDEPSYQRFKQQLTINPSLAQFAQGLPPNYDKATIDQLTSHALTTKDYLEAQQRAVTNGLAAQKAEQEKGKDSREAAELWEKMAAESYSTAHNQQQFEGITAALRDHGVPASVLNQYGNTYTDNVPTMAKERLNAGKTPTEYDQKLAAYNASPDAKTYGPGPEGMTKRDQAVELQKQKTLEGMRISDQKTAREEARADAATQKRTDKANSERYKVDQVYDNALNGVDEIRSQIAMARQGNKEVYGTLPMMIVNKINSLSGIKRTNQAEIQQVGSNVGSLIDKLQAKTGSLVNGRSISPDILSDAEALFNSLATGAQSARNRSYATIDRDILNAPTSTSAGSSKGRPPLSSFEH